MYRHFEKKISSDSDYLHALIGLLITQSIKIRCTRYYFCPCLILRIMRSHCENKKVVMVLIFVIILGYSLHGVSQKNVQDLILAHV